MTLDSTQMTSLGFQSAKSSAMSNEGDKTVHATITKKLVITSAIAASKSQVIHATSSVKMPVMSSSTVVSIPATNVHDKTITLQPTTEEPQTGTHLHLHLSQPELLDLYSLFIYMSTNVSVKMLQVRQILFHNRTIHSNNENKPTLCYLF